MACDPQTMPQDAGCFGCIPPEYHAAVQTYLLARIRGGSMDVSEIMRDTACMNCIPPAALPAIRSYLLCQLANTGGGSIPPSPECDPAAATFIAAAGITDDVQIGAICVLVRDLKAYPAVGTKFWDRDILIYPFVGGNATAHAVNLKNPGTNNLLFLGATPPIHSAFGVQGRLATCWASTQYLIPAGNQDNFRAMWYLNQECTPGNLVYFGCAHSAVTSAVQAHYLAANSFRFYFNDITIDASPLGPRPLGAYFVQRRINTHKHYALLGNAWGSIARASTGVPNRYIYLFATNGAGAVPAGTAQSMCDARISSFSFGTTFDNAGGQAEKDQYKAIWDAFHITLGRGHP